MMISHAIWRDRGGSSLPEFAAVLTPLLLFILTGIDIGRQTYASSVLQGTLADIARRSTLEGANETQLNALVDQRLAPFAKPAQTTLQITNFRDYMGIGQSEPITTDTAPLGTYNVGDCYTDMNANNSFDAVQGSSGIGSAEDAMQVTVTMQLQRITPIFGALGMGNTITITRTMVVESEPYAGVVDPVTRCT